MLCEGGDIEDASYCLLTYVLHPVVTHQQRAVKARRWFLGHRLIKRCNQEECCYFAVFFSNQMFLRICIIPLLKSVRFEQNGGYGTLIGTHVKEQKRKENMHAVRQKTLVFGTNIFIISLWLNFNHSPEIKTRFW